MRVKGDTISMDATWKTAWNTHYLNFCDYFLPSVVGKRKWKQHRMRSHLSSFVTPSDETFAILLYENSLDRWNDLYKQKMKQTGGRYTPDGKLKRITSAVRAEYTNGGCVSNNGRNRRLSGWSSDGLKRWNTLYDMVTANRQSEGREEFEQLFQDYQYTKFVTDKTLRKEDDEKHKEEVVFARHDLWAVNQPGVCNEGHHVYESDSSDANSNGSD